MATFRSTGAFEITAVNGDSLVASPPANMVAVYYNAAESIAKMKLSNGVAVEIGGASSVNATSTPASSIATPAASKVNLFYDEAAQAMGYKLSDGSVRYVGKPIQDTIIEQAVVTDHASVQTPGAGNATIYTYSDAFNDPAMYIKFDDGRYTAVGGENAEAIGISFNKNDPNWQLNTSPEDVQNAITDLSSNIQDSTFWGSNSGFGDAAWLSNDNYWYWGQMTGIATGTLYHMLYAIRQAVQNAEYHGIIGIDAPDGTNLGNKFGPYAGWVNGFNITTVPRVSLGHVLTNLNTRIYNLENP